MPSHPANAYRANHSLSASIIFPSKEYKQYLQWQRETLQKRKFASGLLPTATQYVEFRKWMDERDRHKKADFFPDPCAFSKQFAAHLNEADCASSREKGTATCGHALPPPLATEQAERCPCCLIDCHLQFMNVVTHRLDEVEEPLQQRSEAGKVTHPAYDAWYCAKLEMIQTVNELEAWADEEEAWLAEASTEQPKNLKTATEALELYWSAIICPLACPASKTGSANPKKRVSFGEETRFEPGRDPLLFARKSPRYEPGKYTSGEVDSAGLNSRLEEIDDLEPALNHGIDHHFNKNDQVAGEGAEEDEDADSDIFEDDEFSDEDMDEQAEVSEDEDVEDCEGFCVVFTDD
jgi:hypothetical protein